MNEFHQLPNGKTAAFYLGARGTADAIDRAQRRREAYARLTVVEESDDG